MERRALTGFEMWMRENFLNKNLAAELLTAGCILALISVPVVSVGELGYFVESVELRVYRDGLVHVTQALTVNETFPAVTVNLLASMIENVIVVDENNTILDYRVNDSNMTVFSLGAIRVVIEYDTMMLTEKEAGVWTLTLDTPYNLTVLLPEKSTIMYLNKVPTAISTEDSRTVLQLFPGQWEISYVLPTVPPSPPPTSPTPPPLSPPPPIPIEYLIGSVLIIAVAGSFLLLRRRGPPKVEDILKKHPDLRAEDREVVQFIAERGGKVFEAEIREKFNLPRTTVWRLAKRLEKMEIVTVKRIGLQNQIELRK